MNMKFITINLIKFFRIKITKFSQKQNRKLNLICYNNRSTKNWKLLKF